jgi:hypothetical protein
MAWSGMAAPDRTIVYAHTIQDQASQVPFLFSEFPIDVPYINAYLAEDESLQGQLPTQGEIAIFSQPPDVEEVRRLIRENWDGPIFNETVADPNGKVLVQIFKNRDFPAFPNRSFTENLVYSYWQTPVKWIILVIPLIGILINFSSVLYRRTRSAVIRFLIWLTKPEADS